MIVNLNCLCKVQLSELGKVIWLSQVDSLPEEIKQQHPEIAQTIRNQIDKDDCVEAELWAIMNVFGQYMNPDRSPFRSTCIQLDKNPNFNPK